MFTDYDNSNFQDFSRYKFRAHVVGKENFGGCIVYLRSYVWKKMPNPLEQFEPDGMQYFVLNVNHTVEGGTNFSPTTLTLGERTFLNATTTALNIMYYGIDNTIDIHILKS